MSAAVSASTSQAESRGESNGVNEERRHSAFLQWRNLTIPDGEWRYPFIEQKFDTRSIQWHHLASELVAVENQTEIGEDWMNSLDWLAAL
mmetsp:Transcript_22474/g.48402  ORF Transcript_22474/g.48402 Transcript_22474/m.48402 type:complete len:90 (-) Transcript_22474:214-483(-)